ncbi:MAG: AAA family ATPase [Proteobacteria bacterium]|nr:AAA family ATPase [Pseudomonadota bacterium]
MCVTRPRRFGKSLAAQMLCAYYDRSCDSRPLFEHLAIAKDETFETHLNKYPVISFDVHEERSCVSDGMAFVLWLQGRILKELHEAWPDLVTLDMTVPVALRTINAKTGMS